MLDDERLMAYVDGELTASERATFEQRLDADPELRRRLAGHTLFAYDVNLTP